MLQVYLDPISVNSRKVLAGLDFIGAEYNVNHVDYFTQQHKSPDYLKINPNGTVPAAVDGDCTIIESNAILQYAADHTHGGDSPTYPKDLKKRAVVNHWLLWEASVWFPTCYVYLVEYVVKPLLGAAPDPAVIEKENPKFHKLAAILDAQLGKTKWLAGDELTIADISMASPMHLAEAQKLPLDEHPNLKKWLGEIEKLPCWVKTQGAVEKALVPGTSSTINGTTGLTKPLIDGQNEVRSMFKYTKDVDRLTEIYFYDDPNAPKDIHEPGDDDHEMTVTNGWDRAESFSADKEGFSIQEFHTAFSNWENDESVRSAFYPEIVEHIKKITGAKRVLVFDHTIRSKTNEAKKLTDQSNNSQRAPVMLVHCDYTAESGPLRVRQLLKDEAEDLLSRRVAFLNVWKPIHRTVEERPLAMCDVTSSVDADFFKLFLRYPDRTGENYVMRHNPEHKWWYFPNMTPEQVILLKTYDSDTDGKARFVGHTAFVDPTSKPDAPFRESVEIRTMAFF